MSPLVDVGSCCCSPLLQLLMDAYIREAKGLGEKGAEYKFLQMEMTIFF